MQFATLIAAVTHVATAPCSTDEFNAKLMTFAAVQSVGDARRATSSPRPIAPATAKFVTQMTTGDLYEITAGRIAENRASDPRLRQFARRMITAHQATSRGLLAALAMGGIDMPLPTQLDRRHRALVAELERTPVGARFDAVYKAQQRAAHTAALSAMRAYAVSGGTPELRSFAIDTAGKLRSHVDMLRKLG